MALRSSEASNMDDVQLTMEELRKDYAQIRGVYAAAIREINARLTTLDAEFSYRNRHNPIHHIESRVKSMSSIIKTLVFIKDMNDFGKVNAIYAEYINGPVLPARSCVEVAALPKGGLVEIEVIAKK